MIPDLCPEMIRPSQAQDACLVAAIPMSPGRVPAPQEPLAEPPMNRRHGRSGFGFRVSRFVFAPQWFQR